MARKRKILHQTPPEFAEAQKVRETAALRESKRSLMERLEERERRERIRNMKMPAKRKGMHPYLKRNELWGETYEQAKYRLAHRKAGKIFI